MTRRRTYSGPSVVRQHGPACACAYCAPTNAARVLDERKRRVQIGLDALRSARTWLSGGRAQIAEAIAVPDPSVETCGHALADLDKAIALAESLIRRMP